MFRLSTKFRPEADAFERARAAGFRGAELWLSTDVLAEWRQVLAQAHAFPFYYAVHFPNEPDLESDTVDRAVWLAQGLDSAVLVIHQMQYDLHAAQLRQVACDVRIGVENHTLDRAGFARWAAESPGLTLDVEHLWKFTLESQSLGEMVSFLRGFLEQHGDRLLHVHLPGYRPGSHEHAPMHHHVEMVNEVFTALADSGYSGLVVSEADTQYQQLAVLKRDVAVYRDWFDRQSVPCTPALLAAVPAVGDHSSADSADIVQPASTRRTASPLKENRRIAESGVWTDLPG